MSVIVNVAVRPGHCVKRLCLTLLLQSDQDSYQIRRQTYLLVLFKLHLTCVTVLFHSFKVLFLPDLQFLHGFAFFPQRCLYNPFKLVWKFVHDIAMPGRLPILQLVRCPFISLRADKVIRLYE